MYVAQATTVFELITQFRFIQAQLFHGLEDEDETTRVLRLSIGISKLSPIDRSARTCKMLYATSWLPIHFLGIKETFKELDGLKGLIRGCDTSQLAYIAKNYKVGKHYNRSSWQLASLNNCVRNKDAKECFKYRFNR